MINWVEVASNKVDRIAIGFTSLYVVAYDERLTLCTMNHWRASHFVRFGYRRAFTRVVGRIVALVHV